MPIYKNRPVMAPGTELRRYLTLDALLQTLRSQQLRLTRVDTFPDPFEGSVPKQQIDDQLPIFSSRNVFCDIGMNPGANCTRLDPWSEMTLWRRAKTRSAHASCWSAGHESEAMWRLYCRDLDVEGQGVALESTLGEVEASVESHSLFVSPVSYRYYHIGPAFNDEIDSFMHKRLGFAHEGEVRLLRYNEPQYLALAEAIRARTPVPPDLPRYVFVDWPAAAVIDRVLISPYASRTYEERAREQVGSIAPSIADKIELSALSERRYSPLF
jgi:hypothetical protein